jgi:hypothetical protein
MDIRSQQHLLHGISLLFFPHSTTWLIDFQFSTLICVFTLDRISRRWTLYWESIGQGVSMFLAGGLSRLAINATNLGNTSHAASYGAAAASFIFIFTFVFGATWLSSLALPCRHLSSRSKSQR